MNITFFFIRRQSEGVSRHFLMAGSERAQSKVFPCGITLIQYKSGKEEKSRTIPTLSLVSDTDGVDV